jgi:hypothetical protein
LRKPVEFGIRIRDEDSRLDQGFARILDALRDGITFAPERG